MRADHPIPCDTIHPGLTRCSARRVVYRESFTGIGVGSLLFDEIGVPLQPPPWFSWWRAQFHALGRHPPVRPQTCANRGARRIIVLRRP